jgi:hypothetical protein
MFLLGIIPATAGSSSDDFWDNVKTQGQTSNSFEEKKQRISWILLKIASLARLSLFDFFEGQNRVFLRRNSNRFSRGTPEKWPVVPTPPLDGG